MCRLKSHRVLRGPQQIAILFGNRAGRTGLGLAEAKAHFIVLDIARILAALHDAIERHTKLDAIGLVLTTNVLALVSVVTRDVDNVGLVLDLLLDGCHDDLVLAVAKGFANEILQRFLQRAGLDFLGLGRAGCTDRVALENLGRAQRLFRHLQRCAGRQQETFGSAIDRVKIQVAPNRDFLNERLQIVNLDFFLSCAAAQGTIRGKEQVVGPPCIDLATGTLAIGALEP